MQQRMAVFFRIVMDGVGYSLSLPAGFKTADYRIKVDEYNLPMLASVVIQQAQCFAANIINAHNGLAMKRFKYVNKGTMATMVGTKR
jgi:hypothetical protein